MNISYPCLSIFVMLLLVGCAGPREPYYPGNMGGYYPRNASMNQNMPGDYNRGHGYYGEYRRYDRD